MGRIPEEELERVKRETDLVGLVRSSGVALERRGSDWVGLCPFHDDTDPSLVVTPSKNLWHCLGACEAGGSVIDWVMTRDGVGFREAADVLLEPVCTPQSVDLDPEASDAELLGAVADYYHRTLLASRDALAYLEGRGLGDRELLRHFGVGYAARSLGRHLPPSRVKAGERIRGRLEELGVLRRTGHEHLRGSVVVPVADGSGGAVQLYGRKTRDDLRKGTPAHLYLRGPMRGVWNREALESHDEVILTESLFDAMSFWAAGYENVTTAYGTNGYTSELEEALVRHVSRVLIAFDRDEAGERASEKVATSLMGEGVECYRILFPRGMDANAYATEVTPASQSLGVVIRAARWMGTGPPPPVANREPDAAAEPPEAPAESDESDTEAASSLAATPVPAAAETPTVELEAGEYEVGAALDDRRYRIRGLEENTSPQVLRVNLMVRRAGAVHVDTLDLYRARQRTAFVAQASGQLGVSKKVLARDVGRLVLALERWQEARIREAMEPEGAPEMTEAERAEALELLQDPGLLERITDDFGRTGLVGEETNKLVGYLAAVSRKLGDPLAVIIQSSSAAGKTTLMDAVLRFVPPEERVQYSALTGQSLFYMEAAKLSHKVLAVVEEEGAERASYALKLLQSEGELTIASTGKDPDTGKLVTHEYRVEGPVMIFLTTTAVEIDEELLNRAIVLAVDEDREQTRRVHRAQRERRTLEGLLARRDRDMLVQLHQNAQRLLRPLAVVNPYARELTFLDTRTRTRRDHEKYLTLIEVVALLHQHQRETRTVERSGVVIEYIEVTPGDVRVANRLAGVVLGRSLDELPPQTRRVLSLLDAWVTERADDGDSSTPSGVRFTTRDVREALGLGQTQTKVHLARLVDLEYLLQYRGGSGRPHVYELVYRGEGADGTAFLPGLIDPEILDYDPDPSAQTGGSSAPGRPQIGPESGGGRTRSNGRKPLRLLDDEHTKPSEAEKPRTGGVSEGGSYLHLPVLNGTGS